ncbi:MAG TPA: cyclic nucleotide-binding domain-containing protein [Alphaproteobacteria bacterium]|nr:cyclic nucleotide-binding domain-containing protein [Alphaproteobacteria bacterium]
MAAPDPVFERRTFRAGQVVFAEGEAGHTMYYVERGRIAILRAGGGGPVLLGHVEAGGVFGEMALVDSRPRMASAVAETESVVLLVPERRFREKLAAADPFIAGLVRMLTLNIRDMAARFAGPEAARATAKPERRE